MSLNLFSQEYELWGVTQFRGDDDKGVIYKTDENGNNQSVVVLLSLLMVKVLFQKEV